MGFCDNLRHASTAVYLLVMLFAMSTWVDIVGIWVEMPLMVSVLPEQWQLPAYLTVIIQCANVGPAVYAMVYKIRSSRNKGTSSAGAKVSNHEAVLMFSMFGVAILSMFLMSFFWLRTIWIFGSERAIPFMILVFFTALISCMSSVVFLPYMARFKPVYISAYYIGQGLCGLVPGMVGLAQGTGRPPECVNITEMVFNATGTGLNETVDKIVPRYLPPYFSVDVFLWFLTAILCASTFAYFMLNFTKFCQREMVKLNLITSQHAPPQEKAAVVSDQPDNATKDDMQTSVGTNDSREGELNGLLSATKTVEIGAAADVTKDAANGDANAKLLPMVTVVVVPKSTIPVYRFALLLTMVGVVNAMTNGILPATQSYTCLPFGIVVYTLSIRLSSVAGPLASLSSMFLPRPSLRVVCALTSVAVAISVFHICLAAQSPQPVLKGTVIGDILVIVSSVVMSSLYSFVRVSVASILREEGGRRELLWCGGITQVGSFCGAVVTFVLVSILHIFTSSKPCPPS